MDKKNQVKATNKITAEATSKISHYKDESVRDVKKVSTSEGQLLYIKNELKSSNQDLTSAIGELGSIANRLRPFYFEGKTISSDEESSGLLDDFSLELRKYNVLISEAKQLVEHFSNTI